MSIKTVAFGGRRLLSKGIIRASLLVAGLLVVPFVGFAGTANAAASDCPSFRLCFFKDNNWVGTKVTYAVNPAGTCYNVPISMDNQISSFVNRLSQSITVYYLSNCSSGLETLNLPALTQSDHMPLGFWIPTWNDVITSIKFN